MFSPKMAKKWLAFHQLYISWPQKYSFHREIEPLAAHPERDLGQPMPTSDGESNPATALCTGMVFPWGLSLSEKKEKKKAVVQIRNDDLLFSNDSFTGSGWLVSTSPCL